MTINDLFNIRQPNASVSQSPNDSVNNGGQATVIDLIHSAPRPGRASNIFQMPGDKTNRKGLSLEPEIAAPDNSHFMYEQFQ